MNNSIRLFACAVFFSAVFLLAQTAFGGGPISLTSDGVPSKWLNPINLHPETGSCAIFSNAQMRDKIDNNISHWENVSGVTLIMQVVTGNITEDVTEDNYTDYFVDSSNDPGLNDGINPVIFDDTGQIVDAIFGNGSRFSVLGFAGPDGYADSTGTTIAGGQAFFNCRCLDGNALEECPGNIVFTEDDLDFTMVHEIGHMIGLDHTQVNQDLAESMMSCNLDATGDCDDIPAMYPQSVDAGDQITPQRDDEVALLTIYGLSNLESSGCTVTGSLTDSSGNPLRCADVQAETSDTSDTIAVVSGIFAETQNTNGDDETDGPGECLSRCGDFILRGLDSSKTYTITVKPIDRQWNGGSGIYPCDPQLTGVREEEIGTLSAGSCSAGGTNAMGTIQTLSAGGITEGGSNNGSDDDDDPATVSASLGCSITRTQTFPFIPSVVVIVNLLALVLGQFCRRYY